MFESGLKKIKKKSMEDLGKYLQEQREEQRVSLDEMAFRTKIPIRFIKAMENNQFSEIPSQVSAKGFLRSYAQCLGLSDAPVLEAFTKQAGPTKKASSSDEKEDEILSYLEVKRPSRLPFPRRVLFLVGGVVALLLVLVGLLPERQDAGRPLPPPLLSQDEILSNDTPFGLGEASSEADRRLNVEEPDIVVGAETEGLNPSGGDASADAQKMAPDSPRLASPAISGDDDIAPIPNKTDGLFVLSIEANEPSWVQVEIDGDEIREALLQPSEKVEWTAREKFLLKLGNAGGVRVALDGKDLGSLGPLGEVIEKEILVSAVISE
ncbi:MAG: helix-turn-helix domain-containing protein [Nitrospiria bacterium]